MSNLPPGVAELREEVLKLGWVSELFVGGSAATGDYVPGVSDLDLVAVTSGEVSPERQATLAVLHRALDDGAAAALNLGCVYVHDRGLADVRALHPTWTHGRLTQRVLSGISRAELIRDGYTVLGRTPIAMLDPMTEADVQRASQVELAGYWTRASARPWWWLDPVMVDLGLTSMARGRYALAQGQLLTKTRAIEVSGAPEWLISQMRARRQGQDVPSPRLRAAWIAWLDARRTTRLARQWTPPVHDISR